MRCHLQFRIKLILLLFYYYLHRIRRPPEEIQSCVETTKDDFKIRRKFERELHNAWTD